MKLENVIENQVFDEERALYNLKDTEVRNCIFAGELDRGISIKRNKKYKGKRQQVFIKIPIMAC